MRDIWTAPDLYDCPKIKKAILKYLFWKLVKEKFLSTTFLLMLIWGGREVEEAKAAVAADENNFSERFKVAEQFNFPTEANFNLQTFS